MNNKCTIYRRIKQQGFVIIHEVVICLCCIMLLGVTYIGSKTIINYKSERVITECNAIDAALLAYGRTHHIVIPSTISILDNKIRYNMAPIYPETLQELKNLQTDTGSIVSNIDLSKFTYSVKTDYTGKMLYHLEVKLSNGKTYTSPLSKY